jgi:hypothetical protein
MMRRTKWLAAVLLVLGAPGCVGGEMGDVASRASAVSLADIAEEADAESLAEELGTEDCVLAARSAELLGHRIVWATIGAFDEIALLEVDGVVCCATPTDAMTPAERARAVMLAVISRHNRPDPEPANPKEARPDPEPANPDQVRPDPEPANPDARPDPEPASTTDQNRPDPEPATGSTGSGSSSSAAKQ